MLLTHCTLTGVDADTSEHDLFRLSEQHPVAEWGMLYSPKRQGQPGRYPSIDHLFDWLARWPKSVRVAVHLCGDAVRHAIERESVVMELLDLVRARHGRIQLNIRQIDCDCSGPDTRVHPSDAFVRESDLITLFAHHADIPFILQHHAGTERFGRAGGVPANYSVLFDASGGRGVPATSWPAALAGVPCGYAGGITPATTASALASISAVADIKPFWIDMESSLRDERDQFDLARAERVLQAASDFLSTTSPGDPVTA